MTKYRITEQKRVDYIAFRLEKYHSYYKQWTFVDSQVLIKPYIFVKYRRTKIINKLKKTIELDKDLPKVISEFEM